MSSYRYVAFPQGRQPTADEVGRLQQFAGALANHFAWGTCRDDGRLAVAFDQAGFDHLMSIDAGFEALIRKWEGRGCELLDHLGFVKDPTALRPTSTGAWQAHDRRVSTPTLGNAEQLAAKQSTAQEAVARSLLSVEQTLERYAGLDRVAAMLPYLLIGAAAAGLLVTGLYIRERMQTSEREKRHQTIERVVGDPLHESLHGQAVSEPPTRNDGKRLR
jgi:hypothetical protein